MKYREVVNMMKENGFEIERQNKTSHVIFRNSLGRNVVVKRDSGEYSPPRIAKIKKDMQRNS